MNKHHRSPKPPGMCHLGIGLCLLAGIGVAPTRAATPQEVSAGIEKAKAYLYSQQNKDGNWEAQAKAADPLHWGGQTALAAYALLAADENPADPKLKRAITFLETEEIKLSYAVGLRDQVLLMLPSSPAIYRAAQVDAGKLMTGMDPNGRYGYNAYDFHSTPHNSPSQYGLLAMWACERLGAEVPLAYWKKVEDSWLACQGADGGWTYSSVKPTTGDNAARASMTAAGVASLLITQNYLHHGADCKGNVDSPEIERGFKWLGDHFDSIGSPYTPGYTWYGIERIGVAGGYKYIGKHNWYQEGAEKIIRSQVANGGWGGSFGAVAETSFNLVFLVRGSAPTAINKLKYNTFEKGKIQPGHWNQRPRDCFNFLTWMQRNLETTMNWQIVDLANGSAADLNDAPILYIAGDQPLNFSNEELEKLRGFVLQGGLIVGNPDCENRAFSRGFVEFGKKLFPAYAFRELPPEHPIFTGAQFRAAKWKVKPRVQAMSNGVREFMILSPVDMSRAFQGRNTQTHAETYELLDDIILYACDKTGLREKGLTYFVTENAAVPIRRKASVYRVRYDGNWDPEPFGWKQMTAQMHNDQNVGLTVEPIKLGQGVLLSHLPAPAPATAPAKTPAVEPTTKPSEKELREQAIKQIPPDQVLAAAADPAKLEALIQAKIKEIQAAAATPPAPSEKELREQALKQIPPDQVLAAAADPAKLEALIQAKIKQMRAVAASQSASQPATKPATQPVVLAPLIYPVCDITGTAAFTLTDAQRKELLDFTNGGGTIVIDSAGGSVEFTASAEKELTAIFGPETAKDLANYLPMDHPLFNLPNAKIDTVAWRRYTREKLVGALKGPRIAAIKRNGRIVVLFSREDISAGIVGEPMDGILGYDPQTATALMRNMILYAAAGK